MKENLSIRQIVAVSVWAITIGILLTISFAYLVVPDLKTAFCYALPAAGLLLIGLWVRSLYRKTNK